MPGCGRPASSIARSGERRELEEDALARGIAEQIDHWRTKGDWEKVKCMELLFVCGATPTKTSPPTLGITRATSGQFQIRLPRPITRAGEETAAQCRRLSGTLPRMMANSFTNAELEAFLDESLPAERMAAIEEALRSSDQLQNRLVDINGRRDAGLHSLGEIWRRHRLSCPTREQLGSYLLGVLADDAADYMRFHLDAVGCRYCASNAADLRTQQSAAEAEIVQRRRARYFQSSAGYLRHEE